MVASERILADMAAYNAPDMRRINHALKVYAWARVLGHGEGLPDGQQYILCLAAALHDIGIHAAEKKYRSSAGKYQELEGPAIARGILEKRGVPAPVVGRVCELIGRHHTYTGIDGADCQLLIEADFLVNIEEDHLSRAAVERARTSIFRSRTGLSLLDTLFAAI